MNTIYQSRLIKLISPFNDEVFTLELGGNENELKELISTILNVSSNSIKGIRDSFGNYYTLSSAIKNPHLTSEYSSFYFVVVNLNSLTSKPQKATSLSENTNNSNSPQLFPLSPITKPMKPPSVLIEKEEVYSQIIDKLFEDKYIDEKQQSKLKQMLLDENEELLTLLNLYLKNGKKAKQLAMQITPLILSCNSSTSVSPRIIKKGKKDSNYQMNLLESVEDQFDSKEDNELLKKLLLCDNTQMIKAFERYEYDNDKQKLIYELRELISKYKDKFSNDYFKIKKESEYSKGEHNRKENKSPINKKLSNIKVEKKVSQKSKIDYRKKPEIDVEKEQKTIDKITKKLKKALISRTNDVQFDYLYMFTYDLDNIDIKEKINLYYNKFKINKSNPNITQSIISNFNQYYSKLIKDKILSNYNEVEIGVYDNLIKSKDATIIEFYENLVQKKNLDKFKLKLRSYLNSIVLDDQKEEDENDSEYFSEEEEMEEYEETNEEEEEEESNNNESSRNSESNSSSHLIELQKEKKKKIENQNQKQKNTQNEFNLIKLQNINNDDDKSENDSRLINAKIMDRDKDSKSHQSKEDKKMNEFIKVINSMALSNDNKKEILSLLNNKDENILKLYDKFKKNKMSLTKKGFLQVINAPKMQSKDNKRENDKKKFENFIYKIFDNGIINQKTYKFLNQKYNKKDEMLCSLWEVFVHDKDEEDFIDSIKMLLEKNSDEVNQMEDGDEGENESNMGEEQSYLTIITSLLKKGKFTQEEEEVVMKEFNEKKEMVMSILELYKKEKEEEEALDSIKMLVNKILQKND